jgi:saccharopine dehydrogenase-like NADP-dependent oxidoreductase
MKSIIVIGCGVQGNTIAKRLNQDAEVSEIICADYDLKASQEVASPLGKARAMRLDASDLKSVAESAGGCDLIVNGLPVEYNPILMRAALSVGASYMDMAGFAFDKAEDYHRIVESYEILFSEWNQRFEEKGLTALLGSGSSPGIANVIARESVDKLDTCDRIGIYFYDGVLPNKFIPFWWSPETAFSDMSSITLRYQGGEIVTDEPFSRPTMMRFRGIDRKIRMVDHFHDEPVSMGLLADKVLKGVKQIDFKYGGFSVELSENLYKMGLLSLEPVDVDGTSVVPMHLVLELAPSPPKYSDEIKAIIDAGMALEEGAFLVRVEGEKDGKPVRIDNYVNNPSLADIFAETGLTHESYVTGQSASVFAKILVNDVFRENGLFSPEQLDADVRKYFFVELAGLGVTVDEIVETTIS